MVAHAALSISELLRLRSSGKRKMERRGGMREREGGMDAEGGPFLTSCFSILSLPVAGTQVKISS